MVIDDTNVTINYNHHRTRTICAAVREMSDERKQALLNKIQLRKGVSGLTEQEYNQQTCDYIESLLNGKRPRNGVSK